MNDGRDNRIYVDDDGKSWLTDENGRHIPPRRAKPLPNQNEYCWTTYDIPQDLETFIQEYKKQIKYKP